MVAENKKYAANMGLCFYFFKFYLSPEYIYSSTVLTSYTLLGSFHFMPRDTSTPRHSYKHIVLFTQNIYLKASENVPFICIQS